LGYLTKPVRQAQLYDCLTTVLSTSATLPSVPLTPALWPTKPQFQPRVLVAEDNVVNQKVVVRMLEKLDCRVDVVANGLEAIVAVASVAYHYLCTDCQMPEMDGYEAMAIIRQRAAHDAPHLPIIAMTANAMQSDRERCLAAGMDDYVSNRPSLTLCSLYCKSGSNRPAIRLPSQFLLSRTLPLLYPEAIEVQVCFWKALRPA
jgi:two-component system sensor histidine kinase/response regulator